MYFMYNFVDKFCHKMYIVYINTVEGETHDLPSSSSHSGFDHARLTVSEEILPSG